MNGKITEMGHLYIERSGGLQPTMCPIWPGDPLTRGARECGDWCALFGEPEVDSADKVTEIRLCHRLLIFDHFTDERTK